MREKIKVLEESTCLKIQENLQLWEELRLPETKIELQ